MKWYKNKIEKSPRLYNACHTMRSFLCLAIISSFAFIISCKSKSSSSTPSEGENKTNFSIKFMPSENLNNKAVSKIIINISGENFSQSREITKSSGFSSEPIPLTIGKKYSFTIDMMSDSEVLASTVNCGGTENHYDLFIKNNNDDAMNFQVCGLRGEKITLEGLINFEPITDSLEQALDNKAANIKQSIDGKVNSDKQTNATQADSSLFDASKCKSDSINRGIELGKNQIATLINASTNKDTTCDDFSTFQNQVSMKLQTYLPTNSDSGPGEPQGVRTPTEWDCVLNAALSEAKNLIIHLKNQCNVSSAKDASVKTKIIDIFENLVVKNRYENTSFSQTSENTSPSFSTCAHSFGKVFGDTLMKNVNIATVLDELKNNQEFCETLNRIAVKKDDLIEKDLKLNLTSLLLNKPADLVNYLSKINNTLSENDKRSLFELGKDGKSDLSGISAKIDHLPQTLHKFLDDVIVIIPQWFAVKDASDSDVLNSASYVSRVLGKPLYLPAGTYRITSSLDFSNMYVFGSGKHSTILQANEEQFNIIESSGNIYLRDFTVHGGWDGRKPGLKGHAVKIESDGTGAAQFAYRIILDNVNILYAKEDCIYYRRGGYATFQDVNVNACGNNGFEIIGDGPSIATTTVRIIGGIYSDCPFGYGIRIENGHSISILGSILEFSKGLEIAGAHNRDISIRSMHAENFIGQGAPPWDYITLSGSGLGLIVDGAYACSMKMTYNPWFYRADFRGNFGLDYPVEAPKWFIEGAFAANYADNSGIITFNNSEIKTMLKRSLKKGIYKINVHLMLGAVGAPKGFFGQVLKDGEIFKPDLTDNTLPFLGDQQTSGGNTKKTSFSMQRTLEITEDNTFVSFQGQAVEASSTNEWNAKAIMEIKKIARSSTE